MEKINTTAFIAKAAGYNGVMLPIEEIQSDTVSAKKGYIVFHDGEAKRCLQCGNRNTKGYLHRPEKDKRGKSMAALVLPSTSNFGYELANPHGDFLCEHCGWINVHYSSDKNESFTRKLAEWEALGDEERAAVKKPVAPKGGPRDGGKKILNALIDESGVHYMDFLSTSSDNALYGILKDPPKPPFFILINSGGTVLENMSFAARPTVSRGVVNVTYGMNNLSVSPKKVFAALDDVQKIVERYNAHLLAAGIKDKAQRLDGSEDLFWNRSGENAAYEVSRRPYYMADWFAKELSDFIVRYSRDTRVVAKMILQTYLKEIKTQTQGA